jgi:phage major tail protein, phi13 family
MRKGVVFLLFAAAIMFIAFPSCKKDKKVTGIKISEPTKTIVVGGEFNLTATVQPANATDKSVVWKSDDTAIATVTDGKVKGIAVGETNITVTTVDGGRKATCKVTVTAVGEGKKVTGVKLSEKTKSIVVGGEFVLTATVTPTDATNKDVTWSTDKLDVATVEKGKVKGIAVGEATITVTTKDGNKIDKCKVTVTAKSVAVTGVTLNEIEKILKIGEEFVLTATVQPADATDKNVIWKSDNTAIATVTDGKVKGIAVGETNITVTTVDGGKKATCKVMILSKSSSTTARNSVLLEDFTGTYCGPCYYGMKNIQSVISGFGDKVILVCHHLGDFFAIPQSSILQSFYGVASIPAAMLDRTKGAVGNDVTFHPSVLTKSALEKKLAEPSPVAISLETSYNSTTKDLKVKVTGELLDNLPKARLSVYLIQDGIVYYQNLGGKDYVHRNALRAVLSKEAWGDALGVAQGKFSKEYTYKLPEKIGRFDTDPAQMYIVAFIADVVSINGTNISKNIVHNAAIKGIK